MNDAILGDFDAYVRDAVQPIVASPRRKRIMQEELLAHLLGIYDEQRASLTGESRAITTATHRMGSIEDLRGQLQRAVPFAERMLFYFLGRKEKVMSRFLSILGAITLIIGALVGIDMLIPNGVLVVLGLTVIFGALCLMRISHTNVIASRWIGRHWAWLIGILAFPFGTSIILPSLAKYKQTGGQAVYLWPSLIGTLIVLEGLAFIVYAIKSPRVRPA